MFRTLLTTTALATLLVSGAIAQDAPANTMAPAPGSEAPATGAPATMETPMTDSSILATGYTWADSDNLASEIMGKPVYSSTADDAEQIGDVNNLVVGDDGSIVAVIIGVGGFLGIGEKNVAVNYSELEWTVAADNTERFVLATTREALEAAPEFQWSDDQPADGMMAPADGAMTPAPADGAMAPAPADGTTMAPADGTMAPATGTIDRNTLTDDSTLTAEELIGTTAYGPGDENLGNIGDVVLGSDGTSVEAVIIDFGGFLGIGTKPVAVSVENLRFATDANNNRYIFVNATREQLDAAIAFNADTFDAERDTQLLRTGM